MMGVEDQSCGIARSIDISRFKKEIEFLELEEFITNVYEIECIIREEKFLDTTK